jgi:hypothetical protein
MVAKCAFGRRIGHLTIRETTHHLPMSSQKSLTKKITTQPAAYRSYETPVTHDVWVLFGHALISVEPARVRNQEDFHRSGICVFDAWRDLNEPTRRNVVPMIIDRKNARAFDNVIEASKSLAYHECVMTRMHVDNVGGKVLIFERLKFISRKAGEGERGR